MTTDQNASVSPEVDAYLAALDANVDGIDRSGDVDLAATLSTVRNHLEDLHGGATLGPSDVLAVLRAFGHAVRLAEAIANRRFGTTPSRNFI